MNQLPRSLFIGIYPVISLVGVVLSVLHLKSGFTLSGLALLLTAAPMTIFLLQLFLTDIARTGRFLPLFFITALGGLLILIYDLSIGVNFGWIQTLCIICLLGWGLYIFWYSVFPDRYTEKLAVGQRLLDFELEDVSGRAVSSKTFRGTRNIFLFYRGNWCPLCTTQIKELAARYKRLEAQQIQTHLISPQSHKQTLSIAKKYKVDFNYWIDRENKAAKTLGIFAKNGLPFGLQVLGYESDTVLPTVVMTDEKGQIVYADQTSNYRVRPEPEVFLEVFSKS